MSDQALTAVGSFVIPADHPALPGHFPGCPIVPGVVLLDHALVLVLPPAARASGLTGVRFTAPVSPGQTVEILAAPQGPSRIGFVGKRDGAVVLRGTITVAVTP